MKKIIFILLCISSICICSCFDNKYSKKSQIEITDTLEEDDPDEHDAMCTCDECMDDEDSLDTNDLDDNIDND